MNTMNVMPLFASNLVIFNLDEKFNTIDVNNIKYKNSGTNGQSSEISDSYYVINDYPILGIEIIKIFQQYTVDVLKLSNQFTISTSWFTRTKPGDVCRFHRHLNSFYSGLYYFDDYEENSGDICFLNPKMPLNNFLIVPDKKEDCNINNSNEVTLRLRKRKEKQHFAKVGCLPTILIDDYAKNISQFKARGGIGILHTSTSNTISQLKKLGFK